MKRNVLPVNYEALMEILHCSLLNPRGRPKVLFKTCSISSITIGISITEAFTRVHSKSQGMH